MIIQLPEFQEQGRKTLNAKRHKCHYNRLSSSYYTVLTPIKLFVQFKEFVYFYELETSFVSCSDAWNMQYILCI